MRTWLERRIEDVRFAWRGLRRARGLALAAVLTGALGIGAATTVFSAANAVLIEPLPYPAPDRLVELVESSPRKSAFFGLTPSDFEYAAWRDHGDAFSAIAAYRLGADTLMSGGAAPERVNLALVTPAFLRVLGISPQRGRDFIAGGGGQYNGGVATPAEAIVSHELWMRRFGGDPAIAWRRLTVGSRQYDIAGVLPAGFEFPGASQIDILLPLAEPPAQPGSVVWLYNVIARLRPGRTQPSAQAEVDLVNRNLRAAYPARFKGSMADAHTQVVALQRQLAGNTRPALLLLLGAVGLVMAIACANIASLLLARAIPRQNDAAVRLALGASRGRLAAQLLAESVLLALASGAAGVALASGGTAALHAIAAPIAPNLSHFTLDGTVLGFAVAVTIGCGLICGLAPLRIGLQAAPNAALRQAGTTAVAGSRRGHRTMSALIVSEIALAMVLVAGAGLLIRTLMRLAEVPIGFEAAHLLTAHLAYPRSTSSAPPKGSDVAGGQAFEALLEQLRAAPGVESVASAGVLPLGGAVLMGTVNIEGRPASEPDEARQALGNEISTGYFATLGVPLLEGRDFTAADNAGSDPVAVVNRTFARRFFPGASPVGHRMENLGGPPGAWVTIVGVVGDVKQFGLAAATLPEAYRPMRQSAGISTQSLVLRSSRAETLAPSLQAEIGRLAPDATLFKVQTMDTNLAALIASQRFMMQLLGLFSVIALVLAGIGIYGVLAFSVEQRRREIGIRVALGASPRQVMQLVLGRGLACSLLGATLGVAGALAVTRWLKSLLYGVTPHDPATLAAGSVLLIAVGLLAAWLPARRAATADPLEALRWE